MEHIHLGRFWQSKLKVQWAYAHINHIELTWAKYLATDFCRVIVEPNPQGGQTIAIENFLPLPGNIACAMGDAVHNLRAALDYLTSELVGTHDNRVSFPIHEKRESLERSFEIDGATGKKGSNARIEEAMSGLGNFFLNEIRPYKTGDDTHPMGQMIWALNDLDRIDKHKLLIPYLRVSSIPDFCAEDDHGAVISNMTLTTGLDIGRFFGFRDNVHIKSHGKPTAEILFPKGTFFQDQSVIPSLAQLAEATTQTINLLDEFLVKNQT